MSMDFDRISEGMGLDIANTFVTAAMDFSSENSMDSKGEGGMTQLLAIVMQHRLTNIKANAAQSSHQMFRRNKANL